MTVAQRAGGSWPDRLLTILLMLIMGAAWGWALNMAKLAVAHGGHPVGLALWQTLLAGLVLLVLAVVRGQPPSLRWPVLRFNGVCGLIGVTLPAIMLFSAARHLPAGVLSMAFATMPLFTYGLSALFGVEPVERLRLTGVLLGLAGVAFLVLPESALPAPGLVPWVLLSMAASIGMSAENLYIAVRRPPGYDSVALSCGRQFAGAACLLPLTVVLDAAVPLFGPWGELQWAATGMALASGFAYTLYLVTIRTAGPVFASQTAYVITLAGVLWGMVLFDERHSALIWIALVLLFFGVALVRPRRLTEPHHGR